MSAKSDVSAFLYEVRAICVSVWCTVCQLVRVSGWHPIAVVHNEVTIQEINRVSQLAHSLLLFETSSQRSVKQSRHQGRLLHQARHSKHVLGPPIWTINCRSTAVFVWQEQSHNHRWLAPTLQQRTDVPCAPHRKLRPTHSD